MMLTRKPFTCAAGAQRINKQSSCFRHAALHRHQTIAKALETKESTAKTEAELTTEKLGLEAGLFKVMTSKEADAPGAPSKTDQAKELLKQYGSAYLITSITLAIISMAACYVAVDAGVDVAGLLKNFGLEVSSTSESVGTFAIAYAAHKALSPVRFPPTVALTPIVAKWFGKKKE